MSQKGLNVRLDHEELAEIRQSVAGRHAELEKLRGKMETLGLSTFTADASIEILGRCKVALGDEPEDMFSPPKVDKETGEISE